MLDVETAQQTDTDKIHRHVTVKIAGITARSPLTHRSGRANEACGRVPVPSVCSFTMATLHLLLVVSRQGRTVGWVASRSGHGAACSGSSGSAGRAAACLRLSLSVSLSCQLRHATCVHCTVWRGRRGGGGGWAVGAGGWGLRRAAPAGRPVRRRSDSEVQRV